MKSVKRLGVKLFADGADEKGMLEMHRHPLVKGFTTNPTLMRRAGIGDYRAFAHRILKSIPDRPISFEVFSDEMAGMRRQALEISSWGPNVYVKIPVTNTRGASTARLVRELTLSKVKVNVTAVTTPGQIREMARALKGGVPSIISVIAGRVADTGRDPVPLMRSAVAFLEDFPTVELLWASPRELLNIIQADEVGCDIITATNSLIEKLTLVGKDLGVYSLETVRMFRDDALKAGYRL